jgi:hypothetical protein
MNSDHAIAVRVKQEHDYAEHCHTEHKDVEQMGTF